MRNEIRREETDPAVVELGEIYQAHAYRIYDHLCLLLFNREDAWEVTQDAFAQCLAHLRRGREIRHPVALLYKAATRRALRLIGQMKYRREMAMQVSGSDPHDDRERHEFWARFRLIWDLLDAKGRVVLKTLMVDQLQAVEISRLTGIPHSTVKRRIKKIQVLTRKVQGNVKK